ncbi:MAG: aminomethyl-transferring glycine dehydrogenase [Bacteroidales bacterium]|jgi:glycine dehydrogenase|nr:aminomethyl-transferring glycine dehydrogenase [Bacteroidales bacterium]
MLTNNFLSRHNGPTAAEQFEMLKTIGVKSMDELIEKTIPARIRLPKPLNLPAKGMNEFEYLNHIKTIASKNKLFRSFIGMGYYSAITPAVILRNVLENPGWYTSYTPYQAEISQGRLEALLNYQTMIMDMTAMPIANASLLDEATAAAEAMLMFFNSRTKEQVKSGANHFLVSQDLFPQTIDVLKTRALPLGIELEIVSHTEFKFTENVFGLIVQYPMQCGSVCDYSEMVKQAKEKNIFVAVAADLMSLALLMPPGEWGADCVVGSTQRFGLPLGFGGPAAGYFACKEDFKRQFPGRIIGVTVDAQGNRALRMALSTREQHIKREKATSNICTASALMAIMNGFYAVYHGQEGIRNIAQNIHTMTGVLSMEAEKYGYKTLNETFFDTLGIEVPSDVNMDEFKQIALSFGINFRYFYDNYIGISLNETTAKSDVDDILKIFAQAAKKDYKPLVCGEHCEKVAGIPETLKRKSPFLAHNVFNSYHSETAMMRYIKKLEIKDLSLNRAMIPLGSCTMKLNSAAEMMPITFSEFGGIHPFVPRDQADGYYELIENLNNDLCEITGFAKMSFQPNSGAAGEYAGLMVIQAYHRSRGENHRNVCLIPASAHGTNPATAAMAGMKIVIIKSMSNGEIDVEDLKQKAEEHKADLSCIMITYPSTHGVFEESILDIIKIIHDNGGQVYMDGANMNAQVGLTHPGFMGVDVCHLNLHKTFAMPHGGGGPGVGPIGVAEHLVPFLPNHTQVKTSGEQGISAVSASPFGYPMLLPITYGYIKMLGGQGLTEATKVAILNANYMKAKLKDHFPILYVGEKGMVAHEMIVDCNAFSQSANVQVGDIAKRLMDYGFHAPTVAFPVHGTLMVEPTESEPLSEINRLIDAFIAIRKEISDIENGTSDKVDNPLKNAPHTVYVVSGSEWTHPYTREQAAFPQLHDDKYWPTVGRVDDAYGDRNLMCSCN